VESDAPSQAGSNSPTPTSTSSVATEALETAAAREASSPCPLDAVALSQIASNESATDDKEDRSPAAAPTFRVHLHHDGDFIETVQLLLGELSVGRTRDNDLQIESRYISRRHCKLLLTAAGLSVEDLGSTNGTFVNGAEARRQTLHHGDTVRIGLHELRVDVSLPLD
jgi:hypothetical protein